MLVLLQLVAVAVKPLNVTRLFPWLAPKPAPVTVTDVPTGPDVGLILVIVGADPPLPPTLKATICMNHVVLVLFVAVVFVDSGVETVLSSTIAEVCVTLAVKFWPAVKLPVSAWPKP